MSDDGMIDEFKVEAAELFENAENSLLNIDKGEDFLSNYNNIFRSFHSLKGAAGMFGLLAVQEHMHKLESLFEAQKKVGKMNNKQVDYFLSGIDIAKRLLDGDEGANFYHIEIADFNKEDQDLTATTTPASAPAPALKPKVKLERKKGIIFIVSDAKDSAETISKIFDSNGYSPVIYGTAKEALEVFDSLNPDVIFGGIEMIKAVKDMESEVPTIFISESITQDKIKEAIRAGAYTFTSKPYEAIPLLAICGNAISKHKALELLEKSVNYILYQFTDLDTYLKTQGKDGIRTALKKDLQYILEQRKALSSFSTLGE